MKLPSLSLWLAASVLSVVVTLPFMPFARDSAPRYRFEVVLANTQFGVAQLFHDSGTGFAEQASSRAEVEPGGNRTITFAIPAGQIRALRFDPTDRPGVVTLSSAKLLSPSGAVLRTFGPDDFRPAGNIASALPGPDGTLVITPVADSYDPMTDVVLGEPLELPSTQTPLWKAGLLYTAPTWVAIALLAGYFQRRGLRLAIPGRAWIERRPLRALAVVAGAAVIISNYPVVFLGKSFASPNFGAALLYEATPTLPGMRDRETEDVKGSDVGPLFWQNMTHAMIQRDALLAGEWPLWFRYNSAGTELIGQGQSMFGDPLHFLVIVGSGSAWAWDAKFLLAKWLFALGLGLLALRVSGHLRAALIVAASAAFFGFFSYRINHPAFFSFCYAPWILVTWFQLQVAGSLRARLLACGGLLLANWAELNSGTAKEAYMLVLSLNLVGAWVVLLGAEPWRRRVATLLSALATGVILILLSAPIWLTFLDALRSSYTSYNAPSAFQKIIIYPDKQITQIIHFNIFHLMIFQAQEFPGNPAIG